MIKIGIIGDFLKTAGIISDILKKNSFTSQIINYKHFFSTMQNTTDFMIIGISSPYTSSDYINKLQLDILIINDSSQITNFKVAPFSPQKNGIILLNYDKSEKIELKNKIPFYMITFGFNPKSCITISSRTPDNKIQISIQRNLPTLANTFVSEQDFSINIYGNNVEANLSAISSLILSGISIETLKKL